MRLCLTLVMLALAIIHSAQATPNCYATGQSSDDPALSCQVLAELGFASGQFWVLAADGTTPVQTQCHMTSDTGVARFGRQLEADFRILSWSSSQQLVALHDYQLVTDAEFQAMELLGGNISVVTDFVIEFGEDDAFNADSFMEVRYQDSLATQRVVQLANWTLEPDGTPGGVGQDNQDIWIEGGDRMRCSEPKVTTNGCGTPWSPNTPLADEQSPLLVVQRVHFRANCCKDPNLLYRDLGTRNSGGGAWTGAAASCSPGCVAYTGTASESQVPDRPPMWTRNSYIFKGTEYWVDMTVDNLDSAQCQKQIRESGCVSFSKFRESGRFDSWFQARDRLTFCN